MFSPKIKVRSRYMLRASALAVALLPMVAGIPAASPPPAHGAGEVSQTRVLAAGSDLDNWLVQGRTFEDQRFSPAKTIDQANVKTLGLAWYRDIPTQDGLIAAPIVVDGVIYISAPLSKVYALDAKTGAIKWTYDPLVKLGANYMVAFGARYNRGVAVWEHKVIVATSDCRLIALDADTGKPVWDVSACDYTREYYKTGAPRVGGGMVFSGTAGAEGGARGFVDAHDARDGKRLWRFYTVPTPGGPQESTALEKALPTWKGAKNIGGGTVWDAITYDPELDLVYFGTSHGTDGAPDRHLTGVDHLYLESIIAVKAHTGEYVWHYQVTFSQATFHIMLANLTFDGTAHKVLMAAQANGYFYVLDRTNGKPLRFGPFTHVNWASKMDPQTGHPTWNPEALPENLVPGHCFTLYPGGWGAHNWHAMSYSPLEKLVYLPITNIGNKLCRGEDGSVTAQMLSEDGRPVGDLVAWDPIASKVRWRLPRVTPYNGGTLATAGRLVFEGTGDGFFQAVAADTGKLLWSQEVGSSILGPPVTVALDGEQYVIVPAGNSGSMATYFPDLTTTGTSRLGPARMLAFKLWGLVELPPAHYAARAIPAPPEVPLDAAQVARGKQLYEENHCVYCHGNNADNGRHSVPNLLYTSKTRHDQWDGIVIGGMLRQQGMMPFPITPEESHAIHAYVIGREREAYENAAHPPASPAKGPRTFGGWAE